LDVFALSNFKGAVTPKSCTRVITPCSSTSCGKVSWSYSPWLQSSRI